MEKKTKSLELKTVEDVIKYMKNTDGEATLIRNVEGEPKNWIENYSKLKRGKPEKIVISEDLFMDCFDSPYFVQDSQYSKKNEFYFNFVNLDEEDSEE